MNLVVDGGNTFVKIALFANDTLVSFEALKYEHLNESKIITSEVNSKVQKIAICSVVSYPFKNLFRNWNIPVVNINQTSTFPFISTYETPNTIGIDRLVASAGAHAIKKGNSFLVIDAGTCITYDYVDLKGLHHGGPISPGLTMRIKSMHNYTKKLPLVDLNKELKSIKSFSTEKALQHGTLQGAIHEMKGFINEYQTAEPDLKVFLTGGDTIFFEDALKNIIFAEKYLTLIGLNQLLKINA